MWSLKAILIGFELVSGFRSKLSQKQANRN